MIEIFKAKSVITVNPSMPRAEAVAVRDGLILEAGTLETLQPWLVNNEYVSYTHLTLPTKRIV